MKTSVFKLRFSSFLSKLQFKTIQVTLLNETRFQSSSQHQLWLCSSTSQHQPGSWSAWSRLAWSTLATMATSRNRQSRQSQLGRFQMGKPAWKLQPYQILWNIMSNDVTKFCMFVSSDVKAGNSGWPHELKNWWSTGQGLPAYQKLVWLFAFLTWCLTKKTETWNITKKRVFRESSVSTKSKKWYKSQKTDPQTIPNKPIRLIRGAPTPPSG